MQVMRIVTYGLSLDCDSIEFLWEDYIYPAFLWEDLFLVS